VCVYTPTVQFTLHAPVQIRRRTLMVYYNTNELDYINRFLAYIILCRFEMLCLRLQSAAFERKWIRLVRLSSFNHFSFLTFGDFSTVFIIIITIIVSQWYASINWRFPLFLLVAISTSMRHVQPSPPSSTMICRMIYYYNTHIIITLHRIFVCLRAQCLHTRII